MPEVVVIGGGVIGLSTAFELAGRGRQVTVLDAGRPGHEASWAGAGILPPGYAGDPKHPLVPLCRATREIWPLLSADLRELTGLDNGYRRCGGIAVGRPDEADDLIETEIKAWQEADVRVDPLTAADLTAIEPSLHPELSAYHLPDLCQVRNPRHLKALEIACTRRGVDIRAGQPAVDFEQSGEQVQAIRTPTERLEAEQFLVSAGAWSQRLLAATGRDTPITPVRGQIVLLSETRPSFQHVIEEGSRYLVPRADGRLLVGSTEEWAGFDKRNTAAAMKNLLEFAESLVPSLSEARFERAWSGLRPQATRGVPYLGLVPGYRNLYVAAGHFRAGLNLSPITARLMSQLMTSETLDLPIDAFAVDR